VKPDPVDWDALLAEVLARGAAVPEVAWCQPGEEAAMEVRRGRLLLHLLQQPLLHLLLPYRSWGCICCPGRGAVRGWVAAAACGRCQGQPTSLGKA
jgi:hypothetical protein